MSEAKPIGMIMAGGRSSRFGSPKALARVGGRRVVDRVADALGPVTSRVCAIVNDADLAAAIGLPHRADVHAGAGAIAGLHAALRWADEEGHHAILAVACDLPFLTTELFEALCDGASRKPFDAVVPESEGPRGMEPLCAWYSTRCLAPVEAAIARSDHRLIGFHRDIRVLRLPLDVVRGFGDPATLFANLNTPADRARADQHLKEAGA